MKWRGAGSGASNQIDPVDRSASAIDGESEEPQATLLGRIAVLEGREQALNAELASLRADLTELRQGLDHVAATDVPGAVEAQFEPANQMPDAAENTVAALQSTNELATEPGGAGAIIDLPDAARLPEAAVASAAPIPLPDPVAVSDASDSGASLMWETGPSFKAEAGSEANAELESAPVAQGSVAPPLNSVQFPAPATEDPESLRIGRHSARSDTDGLPSVVRAKVGSGQATSEIDDLIQQAVGSRDRGQGWPGRPPERNEPASDPAGLSDPSSPAGQPDAETALSMSSADDFFIRPDATRKGRA